MDSTASKVADAFFAVTVLTLYKFIYILLFSPIAKFPERKQAALNLW